VTGLLSDLRVRIGACVLALALALVRPGSESSVDISVGSTGAGRYT
jgi:hypothetical protein